MTVAPLPVLPQFRIVTPEHVTFGYRVAGLPRRAMAWLVDELCRWSLLFLALWLLSAAGEIGVTVILLIYFLLDLGYYSLCEIYWSGRSPGKAAMGIRVVSASGARLGPVDALIRNLVRPLDSLPFAMLTGAMVAFLDPYHRRLGDLAAGTLVIQADRMQMPRAMRLAQRDNSLRTDAGVRSRVLARVTRQERDLMLSLVLRRDDLEHEAREKLFADAAAYFRQRYNLPDTLEHLSDEQTVISLALLVQEPPATLRRG